ncbi:hypothetical protein SVIOM74S_03879 [Streptomyces violarus]
MGQRMTRRRQDPNVCGVTAAIAVIDGKWKTTLLWLLESAPRTAQRRNCAGGCRASPRRC